jgi:16S rRNA (guanine966-N2)-methyltransferase
MALISLTSGQKIAAPKSLTRPSAVRARRALFDMLAHRLKINWQGKIILDGFAGAGTLGFEALERQAAKALFIDDDRIATRQIMDSAKKLNLQDKVIVLNRNMIKLSKRPNTFPPADIVFLDPPYYKKLEQGALVALVQGAWLEKKALVILESPVDDVLNLEGFTIQVEHKISNKIWRVLTPMK